MLCQGAIHVMAAPEVMKNNFSLRQEIDKLYQLILTYHIYLHGFHMDVVYESSRSESIGEKWGKWLDYCKSKVIVTQQHKIISKKENTASLQKEVTKNKI